MAGGIFGKSGGSLGSLGSEDWGSVVGDLMKEGGYKSTTEAYKDITGGDTLLSDEEKNIIAQGGNCATQCEQFAGQMGQTVEQCKILCAGLESFARDWTGKLCKDPEVIKAVQKTLGVTADGKWGKKSQAALEKYGKTYADMAPGCSDVGPDGTVGRKKVAGGGGTAYTPPSPPVTTTPPPTGTNIAGMMSNPLVWVGVAAVAVVGVILLSKRSSQQ